MEVIPLPHSREERLKRMAELFPHAPGGNSPISGGRAAALERLSQVDADAYQRTRNFLDGAVTGLSPYLRHGCVTLTEVADVVRRRFGARRGYKLLFELAWRDFWRRVWWQEGDAIRAELAAPRVPLGNGPLPADIRAGQTGLPCMDAFIQDLLQRGAVHNHARMWFAAYCVHFRKLSWRACADWYLSHLLDGDLASNHLSWQWLASSFGAKPYFFNKENLQKYSANRYCAACQAQCPFDDSYDGLARRLFPAPTAKAPTSGE